MKTNIKEPEIEELNKTIVLSQEDSDNIFWGITEDKVITKEFYDWYLINPVFFSKKGMIIIKHDEGEAHSKIAFNDAFSYDFTTSGIGIFCLYNYLTQELIAKVRFITENNLTFCNEHSICSIILNVFNPAAYKRYMRPLLSSKYTSLEDATKDEMMDAFRKSDGSRIVTMAYTIMYNFAFNKSKLIIGKEKTELINSGMEKTISLIYKYTGYVNLSDTRVYKPNIKRDPSIPTREYDRHIEKWSVRGHYRRTSKGLIWIDEHERGEGTLEKRIYGTTKEEELVIRPKVFEVERTVSISSNDTIKATIPPVVVIAPLVKKVVKKNYITRLFDRLVNWWK